ncbi:hypothetical protein EVAR_10486_1 [Eumeta japonica]|uniref:Epidermal growth factor receptor substrate 15-like 1 n=1 Tax=Eumeta variegata TaxID=151549 RepID=A0A4C1THC3_EUMVA|nr:hypothetical protein EVAR_10486_1 [Eumeta japonica]
MQSFDEVVPLSASYLNFLGSSHRQKSAVTPENIAAVQKLYKMADMRLISRFGQLWDGFSSDPFASAGNGADPFGGDAFAAADKNKVENEDPFAVLHAPTRDSASPTPSLPPKKHKTPPPRPAPPRPQPPQKSERSADSTLDFTEDPFKDYRYEDPFNIEDPFADVADARSSIKPQASGFADSFARPTSVAGFETDDFFSSTLNGDFPKPERRSGRVSAPPVTFDPFSSNSEYRQKAVPSAPPANDNTWAAWPNDNWAADDAWATADAGKTNQSSSNNWNNKEDSWPNKTDNWAKSDSWGIDHNRNLNDTWPNTMPSNKKEKSPKSVKYARSLVNTIGGIGRNRKEKEKKNKDKGIDLRASDAFPSEEQQIAWAAAESKRLEAEEEERRRQEDVELQIALAISRQEK